jgi:hypothetical protein
MTCSNGCCEYEPVLTFENGHTEELDGWRRTFDQRTYAGNYCRETGERLNPDGTVTPGVWGEVVASGYFWDELRAQGYFSRKQSEYPLFQGRRVTLVAQEESYA